MASRRALSAVGSRMMRSMYSSGVSSGVLSLTCALSDDADAVAPRALVGRVSVMDFSRFKDASEQIKRSNHLLTMAGLRAGHPFFRLASARRLGGRTKSGHGGTKNPAAFCRGRAHKSIMTKFVVRLIKRY